MDFNTLREKYPSIIYHSYEINDEGDSYKIVFNFSIPGLTEFHPYMIINKENIKNDINSKIARKIIFHVGMVELISYFKCTCSKKVIIEAGYLDKEQQDWFKKLYYYGLGEFMYINKIDVSLNEFFDFVIKAPVDPEFETNYHGEGNLIPIGGGKDSNVTLELLKDMNNLCFVINPKEPHLECIKAANYETFFGIKRVLDKNMLELNKQGFLNGHTPFSSLVAFISYLCAYLNNREYVILSNEGSANESTVIGTKINHQYSKTYEFENDFNLYTKKYFKIKIKYFSLLRPLSEYQIGMLFSKYEKYHKIFKSCNVGSKQVPWVWCCDCPKCLFVYCILSPFLYKEKLVDIFGEDMFNKESLLKTFNELIGVGETKPFECVGTVSEVRYALNRVIDKIDEELPYLLKYYKEKYYSKNKECLETKYNDENNLDPQFVEILKKNLNECIKSSDLILEDKKYV
mgnify:CR=1 FL=1